MHVLTVKTRLTVVLAALSLCAVAHAGRSHSLEEFPRLAGETDDAPRFQRAVDACTCGLLRVPGEDYEIARTVVVTNLCSFEIEPSAVIRATARMDWMIRIDAMWQYSPKTAPKGVNAELYNLTYRGGTLDANGLASCLAIDNYRHFTLENATFLNGRKYGVGIETTGHGYEMIARNLYCKTLIPGLAGNTGLYTYGGDSHYTDIVVVDYTTGVHFAGRGANRLTRIHVWGGPIKPPEPGALPEMLRDSVCFRIDSSGEILRDCYADTGEIGFWVNGWENRMLGCSYFNNTGFHMKDVTIIRQDKGSLWTAGCYFQHQTPETRLYRGGPEAKIRWGEDNIYRWFDEKSRPPCVSPQTMPYNVDIGRQLFLDDKLLAENKAKRTWHRPIKDARSPVLKPETFLEKGGKNGWNPMACPFVGGVWYDGAERLYKCFYNAGWADGVAYAFSKDGLSWTRPKLDGDGGNLVFACQGCRDQSSVIFDPEALDGYRFKSYLTVGEGGKLRGEVRRSKDGVSWEKPSLSGTTGDATSIFYDPFSRYFCFSSRSWNETEGRTRDLAFDSDFVSGARDLPRKARWLNDAVGGGKDKSGYELYNMDCVAYESVMIGLTQVMKQPQNDHWSKLGIPKSTFLRFGFARPDNVWKWTYPKFDETPDNAFIDQTRKYGDWDMGYLRSNSGVCIVLDDEIRFYYTGFAGDKAKADKGRQSIHTNGMYANGTMGFATLRRDGFCSLCDGTVTKRPLVFTKGDRLWLNVDAREGAVGVIAEDLDGKRLGERKVEGIDATRYEAFKVEPAKPFRLRFAMRGGAKLYAFWMSDASGRSGGYLGGGSPSSKTLRDE